MGKAKGISDAVHAKKGADSRKKNPFSPAAVNEKKSNPFEVHVNREKFNILGRTCKHDKGLPGVSRAKADKKRQQTLGKEYSMKHKTNSFRDYRIGRRGDMTDDVINARFVAEKMSQMRQGKASRFNLNDDEILTHRGQTLAEIEQYHDDRSDDDDEQNDALDANFTEVAHFGGDDGDQPGIDRQTAIDEMIVEQKRRKMEIAKEKDEVNLLTERLDLNYKSLVSVLGKMSKDEMQSKPPPDAYDKMMREMIFEPRGVVTDKLLSEDEKAKKEKLRLEQLEKERLKRMEADDDETGTPQQSKHRSADDLDDGYFVQDVEEEDNTLAYTLDGQLGTNINNGNSNGNANTSDSNDDNSDDEEDEEEEEESEDDAAEKNNGKGTKNGNASKEDSDDDDDDSDEDDLNDLKASDSDSDDIESEEVKDNVKQSNVTKEDKPTISKRRSKPEQNEELPYVLDMPRSYAAFHKLISVYSPANQAIIIERLIKSNHPKLDVANRENVVKLFAFLMQYINDLFTDVTPEDIKLSFQTFSHLSPHLYDLMHLNPERMSATLLNVIKQKYVQYQINPKVCPSLDTVIFLRIVANLFSTSDFHHTVVSPSYVFIGHILSMARIRSRRDVATGLFLVTIALEYAAISKRFLPATFNYLLGIVCLSIPKRSIEIFKVLPPFKQHGMYSSLLALPPKAADIPSNEEAMLSEDLVMTKYTTAFKVRAFNTALKLITDAITLVSEHVGSNYLATPLLNMFKHLRLKHYPQYVRTSYEAAKEALQSVATKRLTKLVPPQKKPKALRLLEPRIETVYDDKRRPKVSKAKEEKLKLIHKVKRETKGAVREIRKDTEFLQKMRIKQQIQSDMERKEKVKRIFAEASAQQGELNELARAKKKKKF